MSESIDTSGLEKAQRAIANLVGPGLAKFKKQATYLVAVALRGAMQRRPAGVNSPVIWASEKARRYYFAMRREKGLPLKYTRGSDPMSQRSGSAFTILRGKEEATLGNRATYSPYVMSSQYQTEQHEATGWITDEKAVEQIMSDGSMANIINGVISQIVRESFRGSWAGRGGTMRR